MTPLFNKTNAERHVMKKKWHIPYIHTYHKSMGSQEDRISEEVYIRAGDHPPPFSVSKIPSDRQHLCVRENKNTGGTMKLSMTIYCEQ
jgi:hypothetical protein